MLKEIDIKAGDMTLGQRIKLGKILASDAPELEKMKEAIFCLHEKKITLTPTNIKKYIRYFLSIVEGIYHWSSIESRQLRYQPSIEELNAGINELAEAIGDFGTITALAATYSQDPDTILTWKYGKVFGLIFADFKKFKYQQALQKQYLKK